MPSRNEVFVSYCHRDAEHLRRLLVHLRPYERNSNVELWHDGKIRTGDRWRTEISDAINRAAAAILLISPDFLASDFIVNNELPPLLKAVEVDGVRILPIIIGPCAFSSNEELAGFQAINSPDESLISIDTAKQEELWAELARQVGEAVESPPTGAIEARNNPKSGIIENYDAAQWLIEQDVRNLDQLASYNVYQYHFIDNCAYMPLASKVLDGLKNAQEALVAIGGLLKKAGWEGDGDIKVMWIPPFAGAGVEDTYGIPVWFVKQSNNGTSFLASRVPLPFARLLEQQH